VRCAWPWSNTTAEPVALTVASRQVGVRQRTAVVDAIQIHGTRKYTSSWRPITQASWKHRQG